MADNTVKTEDGAEIYINNIYYYVDQYIEDIKQSPRHIDDNNYISTIDELKDKAIFKGLLKNIYKNVFKITDKDIKYNNKNSRLNYNDVDLLNNIWDIYVDICYKYKQAPTILNFSLMTGIDTDTFNSWKNEEYKAGGDEASSARSVSVKKWLKECESNLYDLAMTGNPGPMFLLKANFGYTEAPQQVQIIGGQQPEQIAADIAARHMIGQTEPPKLPEDI